MSAPGIRTNLTIEDFSEALKVLDSLIDEPIELDAVGGFALLVRGLRSTGVTADIDIASPTFTQDVENAVEKVATQLYLPPDWLNNDTVFSFSDETTQEDVDAFNDMLDASYEPVDLGLRNINLNVADLTTLAKSKAYAACDIGIGRTEKDLDDLVNILNAMGLFSAEQAQKSLPWLKDPEFSETLSRLENRLSAPVSPVFASGYDKPSQSHDRGTTARDRAVL